MTPEPLAFDDALRLALAFLDGPWTEQELTRQGRRVLPRDPGWEQVEACVAAALAVYRKQPWDRPRELAETLMAALAPRRDVPVAMLAAPPSRVPTWPVRPLPDVDALAAYTSLTRSELQWYVDLRGMERRVGDERLRHYRYEWRPAARRPARLIEAPKDRLKLIQRRICRDILAVVPAHPVAHGYVPGRSAVTAASVHVGAELLIQVDLAAFFPSVSYGRVRAIFAALGYPGGVASDLAGLTTNAVPAAVLRTRPMPAPPSADQVNERFHADRALAAPHLPQGAPTSPALGNLALHRLDRRLAGLAKAFDAQVTRYADDITFSGGCWLRSGRRDLLALLRQIVAEEGFRLARGKTRMTTRSGRQQVLGIVVNERLSLARHDLERLEAVLVNSVRTGPAAQNRAGHPDFRAHLVGRLAWVRQVAPHKADRLEAIFGRIEWG